MPQPVQYRGMTLIVPDNDSEWTEFYAHEIVHHAIQPGFRELTPYPVVLVELDEQRGQPTPDEALRIIANLVKPDLTPEAEANVAIGKRVRVVFQDLADHMALPQFTLADEPAPARVWR